MQLEDYGRFGDTEIRNIDGVPNHVNETEAHWIDNYGLLGQTAAKASGSGTINPHTGYTERFWPQVALMVGSYLLNDSASDKAADTMAGTSGRVAEHLEPWKASVGKYQKMSDDYMDPFSEQNQYQRQHIKSQAMDFVGMQDIMNRRNLSSGGVGGFSGVANQNLAAATQSASVQSEQAFQDQFLQNKKLGTSLMDSYIQNLRAYGEKMAQGQIQNDAMLAQQQQQSGQGMAMGLLNAGLSIFGGGGE